MQEMTLPLCQTSQLIVIRHFRLIEFNCRLILPSWW